jgi:DNA-binding HxlR family transcriptional regulator
LAGLFHHRWAVPALGTLSHLGGGAKFITLQRAIHVSRDSLVRTLEALMGAGVVARNPGYGHPMRPEYNLTPKGRKIAPPCRKLVETLHRLGVVEIALNKWSLPTVYALNTAEGRFNALRGALGAITPRALTQALRDLEQAGMVTRSMVDDNPPRTAYSLSRRGRALIPLLQPLAKSGVKLNCLRASQ